MSKSKAKAPAKAPAPIAPVPATATGMTAESDARFANLLEPIRDLAENWSIDIASEVRPPPQPVFVRTRRPGPRAPQLEEYLGELEAITISFEDGRTLNFVEAAMVIQGSACIYGKKVEHLYTLVYQTLNHIVEKKKAKDPGLVGQPLDPVRVRAREPGLRRKPQPWPLRRQKSFR